MAKININPHDLLKELKAILIRHNKHEVWKLPNGAIVVLSGTPSCPYVKRKQVADIKEADESMTEQQKALRQVRKLFGPTAFTEDTVNYKRVGYHISKKAVKQVIGTTWQEAIENLGSVV